MSRPVVFTRDFPANGTFGAVNDAQEWLRSIGCSCGSMQGPSPILVSRGEWPEDGRSKWRHYSSSERNAFDGQIEPIGSMFRDGGARVCLRFNPEASS